MLKKIILWPVWIIGHWTARAVFSDDMHFLLCDCPRGDPAVWWAKEQGQ